MTTNPSLADELDWPAQRDLLEHAGCWGPTQDAALSRYLDSRLVTSTRQTRAAIANQLRSFAENTPSTVVSSAVRSFLANNF